MVRENDSSEIDSGSFQQWMFCGHEHGKGSV